VGISLTNYALAKFYMKKYGTSKSTEIAKLLKDACDANVIDAMVELAQHYRIGNGKYVEQNEVSAFELYVRASKNGINSAKNSLAICLEKGIGTSADNSAAFKLYCELVNDEPEWPIYLYHLGQCYLCGIGTAVDNDKAFDLFNRAKNLGHIRSYCALVLLYCNGKDAERNYEVATQLLRHGSDMSTEHDSLKVVAEFCANGNHYAIALESWALFYEKTGDRSIANNVRKMIIREQGGDFLISIVGLESLKQSLEKKVAHLRYMYPISETPPRELSNTDESVTFALSQSFEPTQ
jgi:hypothetical protein